MANVRVNLGKAVQLTSPGYPYHTGHHVFVGGGETHDWVVFTAVTGTDKGFQGVFHDVVVNGEYYGLRTRPLVNMAGYMNTEGVTYTGRFVC